MEKLAEYFLLEKFFYVSSEILKTQNLLQLPVNSLNVLMAESLENNDTLLDELRVSLMDLKVITTTELNKSRLVSQLESYHSELDLLLTEDLSANFNSSSNQSIYDELGGGLRYIISTTHGGSHVAIIKPSTNNFENTRNLQAQINEMLVELKAFFPGNYFQLMSKTEEFIERLVNSDKCMQ